MSLFEQTDGTNKQTERTNRTDRTNKQTDRRNKWFKKLNQINQKREGQGGIQGYFREYIQRKQAFFPAYRRSEPLHITPAYAGVWIFNLPA